MKKKLLITLGLIVSALILLSCKKKNTTPPPTTPATCNCYQTVYVLGAGGNYYYDYTTSTSVELCAKDGTIEYQGSGIYKLVWTCQ
jgi:hypothetical protein